MCDCILVVCQVARPFVGELLPQQHPPFWSTTRFATLIAEGRAYVYPGQPLLWNAGETALYFLGIVFYSYRQQRYWGCKNGWYSKMADIVMAAAHLQKVYSDEIMEESE